jgi:hypothetical protein
MLTQRLRSDYSTVSFGGKSVNLGPVPTDVLQTTPWPDHPVPAQQVAPSPRRNLVSAVQANGNITYL